MSSLPELIELGDPDELLREIDRRCGRSDWTGVLELRDRCRLAVERGKQLWGVAAHAEYRLALEAPGHFAAAVLDADVGPLALGPLPEVAASTHKWSELSEFLDEGPLRGLTAYECVVRGEDLSMHADLVPHQAGFGMPLRLQPWEPAYARAEYLASEARFPAPPLTPLDERPVLEKGGQILDEVATCHALSDVVQSWTASSNGSARVVGVQGGALAAIATLDTSNALATRVSAAGSLALLAWAGASGGAHGRRAGMAMGRTRAWWAASALADCLEGDTLPDPDLLGDVVEQLEWWTWGDLDHSTGWELRLAIGDPIDGVAFAIDAHDTPDPDVIPRPTSS